jgi:hypothetical protein
MDYAANQKNSIGFQQGYAGEAAQTGVPVSASEAILSRLNTLRMNFAENCQSASHIGDKIVGSAPTPLANGTIAGDAKARPPATCFMDALERAVSELESIGRDTQEHLNRIHRSF